MFLLWSLMAVVVARRANPGGCNTITERSECCNSLDGRSGVIWRGYDCVPSGESKEFPSGNVCEPSLYADDYPLSSVSCAQARFAVPGGCYTITERSDCCNSVDGRSDVFGGYNCVPSGETAAFPSGNVCEPSLYADDHPLSSGSCAQPPPDPPPSPLPDPLPSPSTLLAHCDGSDQHNWPVFQSELDLIADSAWASYFLMVYGSVPASGYPICVATFSHLYKPKLLAAGVSLPSMSDDCPSIAGEFYSTMTDHQDDFSVWIWNPDLAQPATTSLPSNTWVEFIHQQYSMDGDATWMYYAPGTAIWFYLGNTQVFDDHDNAVEVFLNEPCQGGQGWAPSDKECIPQFPRLYTAALSSGLISMQFLKHADMVCGAAQQVRRNMAIEIVDLGGPGKTTCGSNRYRAGWEAQAHCDCDQGHTTVNCAGYGMRGSGGSFEAVVV